MGKHNIIETHAEHTSWISKLDFYTDELIILNHRLEEIAVKNTHIEVLAEVEKFQNQFIIQKDTIDQIRHIIILEEDKILKEVKTNPVAVDHRTVNVHPGIEDLIETFEKNFKELRIEFNTFLAKWM